MKTQEITDVLEANERLADPFEPPVCRAAEIWFLTYLFDCAIKKATPNLVKKPYSKGTTPRQSYGLQKGSPYGESTHLILQGKYAGFLGKNEFLLRPLFNSPSFTEGEAETLLQMADQLQMNVHLDEYLPALLCLLKRIGSKVDEKRMQQTVDNFSSMYWVAYFAHWLER